MSTTTTNIINGVNVDDLGATIAAIEEASTKQDSYAPEMLGRIRADGFRFFPDFSATRQSGNSPVWTVVVIEPAAPPRGELNTDFTGSHGPAVRSLSTARRTRVPSVVQWRRIGMGPETMTAAVLTGHGDLDVLQVRHDVPVPNPHANEVLVRVTAAAVNNTDVWTRQGAYGLPGQPDALAGWRGPITFPRIQGGDIAGVISAVGSEVSEAMVGKRVLVDPAIYRDEGGQAPPVGLLGSEADGGFAQHTAVAAEQVHDMTDSPLSDEQLACLPVAYGTAMGMLERVELRSGETVLVTGASGGVGLALVQLAAARGATVVAVTSHAKADQVRTAGAHHTIVRDDGDLAAQAQTVAPAGLEAVADVAGGALLEQLLPLLADDGRWVIAGAVAGAVVPFDLRRLYLHNRRLIGSSMHTREHFAQLAQVARAGQITPRITGSHPLTDIHQAQRQFLQGQHIGKIITQP